MKMHKADAQINDASNFPHIILDTFTKQTKLRVVLPYVFFMLSSLVLLLVLLLLRGNSGIAEATTVSVTAFLNRVFGGLSALVDYSVFEVFVVCAIVFALLWVAILVIWAATDGKIRALKGLCLLCAVCLLFGSYYMFVAGFAYNRAPLPVLYSGDMEYYDFYKVVQYHKREYDNLAVELQRDENGCVICPYTFSELSDLLVKESARLNDYYNDSAFSSKPMAVFSELMSDFRITGITFAPTGDCGVNVSQPQTGITCTMAHELMHSMGVMRENEANAISCYLLISSDVPYLRYCGYYDYYRYLLYALQINYDRQEYSAVLPPAQVYAEARFESDFWSSRKPITDKIGDFFNSLYLKLSGSSEGTASYSESTHGGDSYRSEDRVFISVKYNTFQQAFIRVYLQAIGVVEPY